eukprot:TRINITY_DN11857_c0_g1_i3.p1 TRINITY_DN11857_c0_g1~~TRINITY_DN11857_c0_g1_i3.p1  ORF type:complete len:287 (+),score=37.20 TRINITY_DN11857_c0_g1_i3:56-916(+)
MLALPSKTNVNAFRAIALKSTVHKSCFPHALRYAPVSFLHSRVPRAGVCRASLSSESRYGKIGAKSTGSIPASDLLDGAETAAKKGAEVLMGAVHKPHNIDYKGKTNLVTDTDKRSELTIQSFVRERFENHLILGEEGGFIGDPSSEYLWCIDPLDGTTNFAHGYPSFAVSVGVLYRGKPAAAAVVEFTGGKFCWGTRTFSATAGGGAFCNGEAINVSSTSEVERSLLVTGFGYDHDEAWATNMELFKDFTHLSRVKEMEYDGLVLLQWTCVMLLLVLWKAIGNIA